MKLRTTAKSFHVADSPPLSEKQGNQNKIIGHFEKGKLYLKEAVEGNGL